MITKKFLTLALMFFYLLIGLVQARAQEPNKQLLLGKLEVGVISNDAPKVVYAFTARADLSIEIEIVIADGDLVPSVELKQGDTVLQTRDSTQDNSTYKTQYSFKESGQYIITISGGNHTSGTFALTVREVQNQALETLILGTPVRNTVARGETIRYQIQADLKDNTVISISINNLTQSVYVKLLDSGDKTIGLIGQDLGGGGFGIPFGNEQYVLEVTNGDNGSVPVDFEIILSRSTD